MHKRRLIEIAQFTRTVADSIPTKDDQEMVRNFFQQIRSQGGVCMQDLDLNPNLKEAVPITKIGKLYQFARYVHGTNTFINSSWVSSRG